MDKWLAGSIIFCLIIAFVWYMEYNTNSFLNLTLFRPNFEIKIENISTIKECKLGKFNFSTGRYNTYACMAIDITLISHKKDIVLFGEPHIVYGDGKQIGALNYMDLSPTEDSCYHSFSAVDDFVVYPNSKKHFRFCFDKINLSKNAILYIPLYCNIHYSGYGKVDYKEELFEFNLSQLNYG